MDEENTIIRIILECDTKGKATQALLDTAGLLADCQFPVDLHSLVAPNSIEALGAFWVNIMNKAMEENVALQLQVKATEIKFTFSGYLLHDKVLLCGSTELSSLEKDLGEIMLINNEQLNYLRLAEKKIHTLRQNTPPREMSEDMLNDFSRLNNELVNKQRALEQKHAEILKLNAELQQARENMEMFAYSVSHDLKEPVRMVKSFMTLFHQKYGATLEEKAKTYVDYAVDGATRLDDMINDLMVYYRATAGQTVEKIDLNKVIKEVQQLLHKQIEDKKAEITLAPLPVVQGSRTGLKQVFQNLISNAIKFVPAGRQPKIHIAATETTQGWQLSVSDNGSGISQENQQNISKLFKRVGDKKKHRGTGMGLAIAKRVIENMKGEIWVESEEGRGSTFYFTMPRIKEN